MKKDLGLKILDKIVLVGIILTILLLVATPLILTAYIKSELGLVGINMPMNISIGIYICAAPYLIALFNLKRLCKIIASEQIFSREIPRYLKLISFWSFSEILIFNIIQISLYFIFDIYLYGVTVMSSIVVSFVSLAIGFLCFVLAKFYETAIEIKEENDHTI